MDTYMLSCTPTSIEPFPDVLQIHFMKKVGHVGGTHIVATDGQKLPNS